MLIIPYFKILLPVRRHLQIKVTHCFHFYCRTRDVKSLTLDEIFVNRWKLVKINHDLQCCIYLSSVLNCWIESVYPIANEGFRPLFHQSIYPLKSTSNIDWESKFGILWSRDGNLNNQPCFSFEPNHFALLIPDKEMAEVPSYETSKVWQQPQLSSFLHVLLEKLVG